MPWRVLVVVLVWILVSMATPGAATDGPCPRIAVSDADAPPRVMRYMAPTSVCTSERGCYGLVLETANDGTPKRVLNLSTYRHDIERDGLPASARVFTLAADLWKRHRHTPLWNDPATRSHVDTLTAQHLVESVLPPVAITRDDLVYGKVVIVGAGRNYPEHAAEAGGGGIIFFSKAVIPTGAYGTLPDPGPNALLDYEAELGFVALENIDLSSPADVPSDRELEGRIAWFIADDLTDRAPQLGGSAKVPPDRGKSAPGFLPLGPWMVAAKDMLLWTAGRGLRIRTEIRSATGTRCAQDALTSDMTLSPSELLQALARHVVNDDPLGREPVRIEGALRRFSLARRNPRGFDLPAGSVVLTGTPAGTAFGATPKPSGGGGSGIGRFFGLGSSEPKAPTKVLAERHVYGYLQAGDEVSIAIEGLGRQDLEVTP